MVRAEPATCYDKIIEFNFGILKLLLDLVNRFNISPTHSVSWKNKKTKK